MKLIKKKEVFSNINSEYEIPSEVQKQLMNGNAQFIFDLAQNLGLNSYSTVSLAIYLCNYFFYQKCYLQYDRFLVCAASLLLAQKIKDGDLRMRKLLQSYYKLIQQIEPVKMANEAMMQSIQNKICIAESRLLKVIEFDFDIKLPFDYIEVVCKKCVPKKIDEDVYHTVKILILDSYRTYACLVFYPQIILIGCFLIACSQLAYNPYNNPPDQLSFQAGENEEENYKNWLIAVEKELKEYDLNRIGKNFLKEKDKEVLKQEDIKDFLIIFNELLFLNTMDEKHQNAAQNAAQNVAQQTQQMQEEQQNNS